MKKDRVRTVDQELFHIIRTVNSRDNTQKAEMYVGILVTDNVSSNADANVEMTLEHAEKTIVKTASTRREFLTNILTEVGILKPHEIRNPQQESIGY